MSNEIQINHLKSRPRTDVTPAVPGSDGLIRKNTYPDPTVPPSALNDSVRTALYLLLAMLAVPFIGLCFMLPPVGVVSMPVAVVIGCYILFVRRK